MLLCLDNAKKVAADFKRFKGSGAMDLYHTCDNERISVSDYLEKLDPSELNDSGQPVSNIDAFTRHLMALDLKLSGPNQLTVENLMASAQYLMPEMIRREILAGMSVADKFSASDCVSTTVPSKATTYHPLYIPDLDLDSTKSRNTKSLANRANTNKGGEFPRVSIIKRDKDIVINDSGRVVEMSYGTVRDYGWQDVAIFFRLIGAQMAVDHLYAIYDLGINGDGTVGAATDTFNGAAGTLTYQDLIHNHSSFSAPFQPDRYLCPLNSFETLLSMAQFSDPEAWASKTFQVSGKPITPMGGKLKQVNTTPAGAPTGTVIVTLDSKYAVKEVVSQELMVEAAKIISRKFEEAAISEEREYCVIADGAIKRIVWT